MSREQNRKNYYSRDRDREWDRQDYRSGRPVARKRSRSPNRGDDKRRSRSPRKIDKDLLDENILSEISKLPEPSELWDTQFQEGGFAAPPPSFQPEGISNTNIMSNYQAPFTTGLYDDFPSLASVPQSSHPAVPDMASWNQMSLPPPPAPPAPVFSNVEDQIKKEAAIESEMRHQKAALSKQREDYIKKAGILKKELDTLKDQRNELRGDAKRSPSPDTKRFLKENTKLQLEIQNKLKTINNVVDMLNGIIGEEAQQPEPADDADRPKRKSRSPSNRKFNYVYYDPEMHWCRVCNEFPPTAKDYLNHLHSPAHHKMAAAHMEAPWHSVGGLHEGFPSFVAAPTKRTPIRGLQFFVPSTAWYCKLCDQFIGDLHCASAHLKSIVHSKNYTNFVEQNPHWETDWMSDRQKAFEKVRQTKGKPEEKPQYTAHTITFNKDGFHTKRKDSPTPVPEEKKKKKDKKKKTKKKSSSSSSSNSSSSDSEPVKKKKSKSKKHKVKAEAADDKVLTEWMSAIQMDRLNDSDRKLLDNIKSRIKKEKIEDKEPRQTPEPPAQYRDRSGLNAQRRRDSERRVSHGREQERERESRSRESRSRESRGRESRGRESRERERRPPRRRDDRHADSRERDRDRDRDTPKRTDDKKPEVRKMPFIGKMPVYKHLGKLTKTDDQKKDDQKKRDDEESIKKRREEMDAEIQKKVAEFKEKIAKAQLERQHQTEMVPAGFLPPPSLHLPSPAFPPALQPPLQLQPALQPQLQPAPPAPPAPPQQAPTTQSTPQPTLPKDFQEALDIIFPSEVKSADIAQDFLANLQPGILGMAPFPPLGMMPQMFGFDLNASLFPPRPQLYDNHVPLVPSASPKPRQQLKTRQKQQEQRKPVGKQSTSIRTAVNNQKAKEDSGNSKNKEELDDLAMLGIDASDVGAGI